MAADDWYRNKEWNTQIETAFNEKLRRARDKAQYLRIQACILAPTHPSVALHLLDEYFKLNDNFDQAQAHVDRATAYLALGQIDLAIVAFEAALTREQSGSGVLTSAYIDYPFLIASNGLEDLYERCHTLLKAHQNRLMFPVDYFKWHAALAIVLSAQGMQRDAEEQACIALTIANKEHSGFQHHPNIGLVGNKYERMRLSLKNICNR